MKNTKVNKKIDFSQYDNVFCDSKQALEWAYKHNLPKKSIIRTSSPAMLCGNNNNIRNIDSRWTISEMKEFQTTIYQFTKDIYDASLSIPNIDRVTSLCVSQTAMQFQKFLFKAACLNEEDFIEKRLFLRVEGNGGLDGNNMNAPWDKILNNNPNFSSYTYTLQDDDWKKLTTKGVSVLNRIKLGGVETIIYRTMIKFMKWLPDRFFDRVALIPNENELVIETAAKLAMRGVKIEKIQPNKSDNIDKFCCMYERQILFQSIKKILNSRFSRWVSSPCIPQCESIFFEALDVQLDLLHSMSSKWNQTISNSNIKNKIVLTNSPGNFKGQALASACSALNIPIIAAQHGVTVEISDLHNEVSVKFDNTISDCVLSYNEKVCEIENKSYFSKAETFITGISSRHIRMKYSNKKHACTTPIVYITNNLYRGNFGLFGSWITDYKKFTNEQQFVTKVLGKVPHKVRYKTYPNDNRPYADNDPILSIVQNIRNIEVFNKKVDMRYLMAEHKVLVTFFATSTLGWAVMTGKPVVFINQVENGPLTEDALNGLSEGLFVFNDNEKDFHNKLCEFLSQPISEIEILWEKKKALREKMIYNYFSMYTSGAGARASKMILKKYL